MMNMMHTQSLQASSAVKQQQQQQQQQQYMYPQLPDPMHGPLLQHPILPESALQSASMLSSPIEEEASPTSGNMMIHLSDQVPMRRSKSRSIDESMQDMSPQAKASFAERMRMENRERKKRWRERNEDRNKDNDLRCRVNKRASKLFGLEPSEHKARWTAEEFERRRQKRKEKEARRKMGVSGLDTTTSSANMSPLTSGQTTPVSANHPGLSYSSAFSSSSAVNSLHQQHLSGYEHAHGDFGMTANDASTYMNVQLERKLPPPSLAASAPLAPQTANSFLCNCQGTTHTSDCRQHHLLAGSSHLSLSHPQSHAHHAHHSMSAAAAAVAHQLGPMMSQQQQQQHQHHQQQHQQQQQQHQHHTATCQPHTAQPRSEEDFPMDAVITLMQLNNGWRTLGGHGPQNGHAAVTASMASIAAAAAAPVVNSANMLAAPVSWPGTTTHGPIVSAAANGNHAMMNTTAVTTTTAATTAAAATVGSPIIGTAQAVAHQAEPMTPSLSHSSTISSNSSVTSDLSEAASNF
ncbi:hypothetical protein BDF19DRAFT_440940 [Syncephalis fuscata]|nr:hypothetical protein BDF19DRAFT_440940 [Syncephalis fuscata]